jgi:hypothetical protein
MLPLLCEKLYDFVIQSNKKNEWRNLKVNIKWIKQSTILSPITYRKSHHIDESIIMFLCFCVFYFLVNVKDLIVENDVVF